MKIKKNVPSRSAIRVLYMSGLRLVQEILLPVQDAPHLSHLLDLLHSLGEICNITTSDETDSLVRNNVVKCQEQ